LTKLQSEFGLSDEMVAEIANQVKRRES
jgi:hypothetical protein